MNGIAIFDDIFVIAVKNHNAVTSRKQGHKFFFDLNFQIADQPFCIVEFIYGILEPYGSALCQHLTEVVAQFFVGNVVADHKHNVNRKTVGMLGNPDLS